MRYHVATGVYKKFSILSIAFVFALTSISGAALPLLLAKTASAAGVTVRPSSLNGWVASGSGGSFSNEQAKTGSGSYRFATGTTGGQKHLLNKSFAGTKLSDITSLGYSSYVETRNGTSVAPLLRIDTQLPKSYGSVTINTNTTLIWEPANGPQSTTGAWQDYDPLTQGRWWASPSVDFLPTQNVADTKTWSQIVAQYPNATVRAGNGVYLSAGQNSAGAPWSNFVGYVDNFKLNGNVYNFEPNANPVVNGENFNTHSGGDYKGINVGFNIDDFGTVSNVTVDLYKDATKIATNTSNSALLTLINNGENQLSTPFIISGDYVETYWNLGDHVLSFNTKPTKAVVTVTGENGTRSTDITPLTEPNNWVYESLIPLTVPTLQSPTDNAFVNGATLTNSWTAVDGATKYEYRSFNNAAGTNPRHQEVLNATSKTATNVANNTSFWWQVRAINDYGQSSWSPLWKVTVDNEVPTTPTNGQPHNIFKNTASGWSYTWNLSTDNQGPVKYEYQASTNPAQSGGVLTTDLWNNITNGNASQNNLTSPSVPSVGTSDGKWYWQVRAIDAAGNKSGWSQIWNVNVDTNKPVINDITPGANSSVKGTVTFKLNWSDTNKSYSYIEFDKNGVWKLDNTQDTNPNADELTINTKNYADGVYGIKVNVIDKAGNSVQQTFTFTIDNAKPTLSFSTPDENTLKNGTFPVTVNATDNINLKRIAVNIYDATNDQFVTSCGSTSANNPLNVLSSQLTCTAGSGLADGAYTLRASATDLADNTTVTTRAFRIDNAAPIITPNIANESFLNGTRTISMSVDEANPKAYNIRVLNQNGSVAQINGVNVGADDRTPPIVNPLSFSVDTTKLVNGNRYQIVFSAVDQLEQRDSKTVWVTVDNSAPTAAINSPANGGTFGGTTYPTINFTANDPNIESWTLTGSSLNESGTTNGTFDRTWNTAGLSNGTHTATLTVRDKAGNVSTASLQINVDNEAAITSSLSNGNVLNGTQTITASLGESGAITSIEFRDENGDPVAINGTTTSSPSGQLSFRFNTALLANGDYTVTFRGSDALGNNANDLTVAFEIFNAPFVPSRNTSGSTGNTSVLALAETTAPAAQGIALFNNNIPTGQVGFVAGASTEQATSEGRVKAVNTSDKKEKEIVEAASSNFAWYWILLAIAVMVAAYYAYRNWKLGNEK